MKTACLFLSVAILTGAQMLASVSVNLTAPASTVLLGETLTFTASARDSANPSAQFTYQFTYRPSGAGPYTVLQDFYTTNTFPWTPSDREGTFDVGVTAQSSSGASASTIETVYVAPRSVNGAPAISATKNTLVALYSAPPCNAPGFVRVRFGAGGLSNHGLMTPMKSCNGTTINFYLGGMKPNTTYVIQQDHFFGNQIVSGPIYNWRTGNVPSSFPIPSHVRLQGPQAPTSVTYPFVLRSAIAGAGPFATDLDENVVWYAGWYQPNDTGLLTNLLSGGTFLAFQDDPIASAKLCPHGHTQGCGDHRFFREFDMAGNTIRETNWSILNAQMNIVRAAQHKAPAILDALSHEGIRLPNGYLATMATDEQVKDQGAGPVDVLGDAILILDGNLRVVWQWDAFDYLDVRRLPRVGPTECTVGAASCPVVYFNINPNTHKPFAQANDWTHANAIFYDQRDGNLVLSFRNQSWVIKIAYENGRGDGHIIYTLGFGGSFQLASGFPVSDWFSGQHNSEFQPNGLLTLFDDNNPSPASDQPGGDSRGQAWEVDTTNMVATPIINFDLGSYSSAVGSASMLSNGNYTFTSGFIDDSHSQITEFTPSGSVAFKDATDSIVYRSFRIRDLYTP